MIAGVAAGHARANVASAIVTSVRIEVSMRRSVQARKDPRRVSTSDGHAGTPAALRQLQLLPEPPVAPVLDLQPPGLPRLVSARPRLGHDALQPLLHDCGEEGVAIVERPSGEA